MRIHGEKRRSSEIDVSAFADIAFLMIIFFILTTTFVRTSGNTIEIPSGTTDEEKKEQQQLTVNLKRTGIYYGEKNEELSLDEFRTTLLREDLPSRPEDQRMVIVDSGPDVPYERYYQVLMAISSMGGVVALIDHEAEKK
jgi:biopolymer transport protein ExbD